MHVDTADARRASTARMPGSQVVRKTESARERTDRHSSVSAQTFVSIFELMVFTVSLFYWHRGDATESDLSVYD